MLGICRKRISRCPKPKGFDLITKFDKKNSLCSIHLSKDCINKLTINK